MDNNQQNGQYGGYLQQPDPNQQAYGGYQQQPDPNQQAYGGYQQQPYPNQQAYGGNPQQSGGVCCPKCGSNNLQVIQEQHTKGKDFKGGNACCGAVLFGPIGILCGSCGKGKQLSTNNFWLCNNCGNKFKV